MTLEEWDEMTVQEKILSFPERHPHTFKCVLYLYIFAATDATLGSLDLLMRQMGFERMDLRYGPKDGSFEISAPTYVAVEESYDE